MPAAACARRLARAPRGPEPPRSRRRVVARARRGAQVKTRAQTLCRCRLCEVMKGRESVRNSLSCGERVPVPSPVRKRNSLQSPAGGGRAAPTGRAGGRRSYAPYDDGTKKGRLNHALNT